MARPQQGQLNILGSPGDGVGNLIANQAGRTAQKNQTSSAMLQTVMNNASQEAIASQGQAGATERANISADTSLAQSRIAAGTARSGQASQERMQGEQIEASDRQSAAQITANQWQTRFQAETTKQIASDNLALDQSRLDYDKSIRREDVDFAKADRQIQIDQFDKTHDATVQFNKTQMELKMMSFAAMLKMATKDMGAEEAEATEAAIQENLITDYEGQRSQIEQNGEFTLKTMQEYVTRAPDSIFSLTADIPLTGVMSEGMKGQGFTVNDEIFTDSNKLAEYVAEHGAGAYMALEHVAKAAEDLFKERAETEGGVKKPGFFSALTDPEKLGKFVGSQKRLDIIEARSDELRTFRHMLNKLDRSNMPLGTDGRSTVGKMVPTWKSIYDGRTAGAVVSLKSARGDSSDSKNFDSYLLDILEVVGKDLSPDMRKRLEESMGSNVRDRANQPRRSEILNLGVNFKGN